jgi:hypothetical protein
MDLILDERMKLRGTPEELAQFTQLTGLTSGRASEGVLSDLSNRSMKKDLLVRDPDPIAPIGSALMPENPSTVNVNIDAQLFFRDVSPLMAAAMLACIKHDGILKQADLLEAMGVKGPSLRRCNGGLNNRIRVASNRQIQTFFTVQERTKDSGLADRVYTVRPEVLRFLRQYENRIRSLTNEIG